MLNRKSITAVNDAVYLDEFVKPLYKSYCYSNIPQTIKNILIDEDKLALPPDVFGSLSKQYDKVILFLIDGFGWNVFEEYKDQLPFLKRFIYNGEMSKLTTQYPSTTANQITSMHPGLPVGQHGNYEWFHYEPHVDAMIAPLLFSYAGKKVAGTLNDSSINPKKLYPSKTIYKELSAKDIKSTIFLNKEFAFSAYNVTVSKGAKVIPYANITEGISLLFKQVSQDTSKSYYYFYTNVVDTAAHNYGVNAPQCRKAILNLFKSLEEVLHKEFSRAIHKTLFLLTSDHGHKSIDASKTLYLNLLYPEIIPWIMVNKKGAMLVPGGTCRDMYLHIKLNSLQKAQAFLQEKLGKNAVVYKVQDLINQGFFGLKKPNKLFMDRVGNLAIICRGNASVWWYEKDKFEISYKSHHGSLTREEMEIPFGCLVFD